MVKIVAIDPGLRNIGLVRHDTDNDVWDFQLIDSGIGQSTPLKYERFAEFVAGDRFQELFRECTPSPIVLIERQYQANPRFTSRVAKINLPVLEYTIDAGVRSLAERVVHVSVRTVRKALDITQTGNYSTTKANVVTRGKELCPELGRVHGPRLHDMADCVCMIKWYLLQNKSS